MEIKDEVQKQGMMGTISHKVMHLLHLESKNKAKSVSMTQDW